MNTGRKHALRIWVKHLKWGKEGKEGLVLTDLEPTLVTPAVCLGWLSYNLRVCYFSLWATCVHTFIAQRVYWLTCLVSKWQMGAWPFEKIHLWCEMQQKYWTVWIATLSLTKKKKVFYLAIYFTCKELPTMAFMNPMGRSSLPAADLLKLVIWICKLEQLFFFFFGYS